MAIIMPGIQVAWATADLLYKKQNARYSHQISYTGQFPLFISYFIRLLFKPVELNPFPSGRYLATSSIK
jgi:hypothetical protein